MAFVDGTAVNVALPVLQATLRASVASAQWVVEAYALFLSALVLVGGSLADRVGRRRIFSIGTVVFAASSLACGLAPDVRALIAARAVQGVGAALLIPSSLAILGAAFPPGERGRAVGTWSALTAIAGAVGPILGGWLVQAVSWRAVFYLNLPIAGAVLWISARKVPESRNPDAGTLDVAGALLATAGLGLVIFGLIEAPAAGWSDPRVWASLGAGAIALGFLIAVERRSRHPMVPTALFRIRTFAAANLLTFCLYAALSATFFFLPFDLIQARGYSPALAGASMLPLVAAVSLLSRFAGAIADRLGARLPLTVGPAIAGIGFFLLAVAGRSGSFVATLRARAFGSRPRHGDHHRAADGGGAECRGPQRRRRRLGHQQRGRAGRLTAGDRGLRDRGDVDLQPDVGPPARSERGLRARAPSSERGEIEARRDPAARLRLTCRGAGDRRGSSRFPRGGVSNGRVRLRRACAPRLGLRGVRSERLPAASEARVS